MQDASATRRYRVVDLDCARDAAQIEEAARSVPGVASARVSTATHILTLQGVEEDGRLQEVEGAVTGLGYRLEPLGGDAEASVAAPAHAAPGYRRALWIVVLLNVGYGVVEMIGGFISGSQALRADALDFLGDGLITFFGLQCSRSERVDSEPVALQVRESDSGMISMPAPRECRAASGAVPCTPLRLCGHLIRGIIDRIEEWLGRTVQTLECPLPQPVETLHCIRARLVATFQQPLHTLQFSQDWGRGYFGRSKERL